MLRRNIASQTRPLAEPLNDSVDFVALHASHPERYPFLLQSSASDGRLGRFDILFAAGGETLVLPDASAGPDFLTALDELWQRERIGPADSELPFLGGWFLYLGYELAAQTEPVLELADDPLLPCAFAVRCPAALIREHDSGRCWLVIEDGADISAEQIRADVAATRRAGMPDGMSPPVTCEERPEDFLEAVVRAREYIAAGDIYQANLSRAWHVEVDERLEPEMVYAALCSANPAPFAGLLHWEGTNVISSSPERLLSVRDGIASTRPIAGTRPRSADPDVDSSLSTELFANAKERAEHVMLIDLERNDLGRVCEAGSVEVDEMMVLESYAHVHHIVSNVRGRLRANVTPGEAIRAVFPGGTITGCPKVRCMQIISELEDSPRGAYTGSFGYLNRDGSLDLNIMIRTMVMRGNRIQFRAGSGIVADSEPDAELAETRAKAEGLLRSLTG
ncbi:MAG: aminodeoxychorismate synthase component I [Woeseiaceae bacterium]|nr:aminodeoxychorismate synthase component I [Woeseiaceae bacterium]